MFCVGLLFRSPCLGGLGGKAKAAGRSPRLRDREYDGVVRGGTIVV